MRLYECDKEAIKRVLMGRTVSKVDDDTLVLDDGRQLTLAGNSGGCGCGAGNYELTELNGVDNIITGVEFEDSPSGYNESGSGHYRIFVFADNVKINLATFEGDDGSGCYGTGYTIRIQKEKLI